ncbi:MAG: hypothetical protein ACOYZ8_06075 [Chloroflexota bacterium]
MSRTWKWILGIVIALVVIGALAAAAYAWHVRTNAFTWDRSAPFDRGWDGFTPRGEWQHPMLDMRGSRGFPLSRHGFVPFGGFFLLGGLVKLAVFFGLLYGAYWLGRRNARIALDPSTGSGQRPAPAARVDASAPPEADPVLAPRKRAKKTE